MDQNWHSVRTNSALYQARLREVSRPRARRSPAAVRTIDAPRWSARLHPRRSISVGGSGVAS